MTRDEILSDDEILRLARESGMSMLRGFSVDTQVFARAVERTVLERAKAPSAEPVAWMYHGIRFDDTPHDSPSLIWRPEYMDVMSASKGAKATPLYTHPPDARKAMRMALEALEEYQQKGAPFLSCDAAADALRTALGEQ